MVLFPRYQVDVTDTWQQAVDGFRRGVQIGFGQLGSTRLPVVAAGYSLGGALVNYYAGNARAWKVPVPRSVFSIFPTTRIAGRSAGDPASFGSLRDPRRRPRRGRRHRGREGLHGLARPAIPRERRRTDWFARAQP